LAEGSLAIFDTGGGSTQFTFGHTSAVEERFSLNVGSVRYTERYGLSGMVTPVQLRVTLDAIAADLARLGRERSPDVLVGMGGAITNITAVKHGLAKYDPNIVQGSVIERAEVERQIELYRSRSLVRACLLYRSRHGKILGTETSVSMAPDGQLTEAPQKRPDSVRTNPHNNALDWRETHLLRDTAGQAGPASTPRRLG